MTKTLILKVTSWNKLLVKLLLCLLLLNFVVISLASTMTGIETSLLSKANLDFTFKLHKELSKGNADNVFFSPFSIATALAMTYLGAKGNTAQQMAEVLTVADMKDKVHESFEKYISTILTENDNFVLYTANRLFPNQKFKVEDDFTNNCIKHYQADVAPLDFVQNAAASKTINKWVSEKTKGKINDLISPDALSGDVFLVLVNAIYFKGNWASQFDKKHTKKDVFHVSFSEEVEVDMMYQKRKFHFTYDPKHLCSVLELPYKGESLSMVFILPDTIDGLPYLEETLTPETFSQLQSTLRNDKDVEVYLPKFKLETKFELSTVLSKLGMPDAFDAVNADFSGMDKTKSVYISQVIHQAFVEVNEEGTEAAAATAVKIMRRAAVRNLIFKADKPFLFFIKDRKSNMVLFSGRYTRPEGTVQKSTREEL